MPYGTRNGGISISYLGHLRVPNAGNRRKDAGEYLSKIRHSASPAWPQRYDDCGGALFLLAEDGFGDHSANLTLHAALGRGNACLAGHCPLCLCYSQRPFPREREAGNAGIGFSPCHIFLILCVVYMCSQSMEERSASRNILPHPLQI